MKSTFPLTIAVVASLTAMCLLGVARAQSYDWSGPYAGLNAGGSWGKTSARYTLGEATINGFDPDSFIGGGHLGYGLQSDFIFAGLEADMAWRHGTGKKTFAFANGIDFSPHEVEQNWVGTFRPRFGFVINQFLLYGTAGLAYGNLEHKFTETRPGVATRSKSKSEVDAGWTVGGGVEYGIASRLSAGIEYLYMSFGETKFNFSPQVINALVFPASSTTFDDRSHVVRLKVTYHF
ncbi:MAG TPA: outer membrane beta-barrel protein [Candidatus Binatia bacterium]|jgi:outer membrane immunogenic protein